MNLMMASILLCLCMRPLEICLAGINRGCQFPNTRTFDHGNACTFLRTFTWQARLCRTSWVTDQTIGSKTGEFEMKPTVKTTTLWFSPHILLLLSTKHSHDVPVQEYHYWLFPHLLIDTFMIYLFHITQYIFPPSACNLVKCNCSLQWICQSNAVSLSEHPFAGEKEKFRASFKSRSRFDSVCENISQVKTMLFDWHSSTQHSYLCVASGHEAMHE